MLDEFVNMYIDKLYTNENNCLEEERKNLFSKDDYFNLLLPVINILKKNNKADIDDLRNLLFEENKIIEVVKNFVIKKKKIPGMVLSYGTSCYQESIVIGNKQEVTYEEKKIIPRIRKMELDTIFDIASNTKLFTALSTLKLIELGKLSFDDRVMEIVPFFKKLKDITIKDLLSFNVNLETDKEIGKAIDREEAEEILFNIRVIDLKKRKRIYNDKTAMVLKYIIEYVSGMSYYEFLKVNILDPLKMHDTYVIVPVDELDRVASSNYGVRFYKGERIVLDDYQLGEVNDPKARIMNNNHNLSGHAGLFSTSSDINKLIKGLMNTSFLKKEYIDLLTINNTGKPYREKGMIKYHQCFSFLCYVKNPILENSEIHHAMSSKTFASCGYTGTYLMLDVENKLFMFLGSNRTHNRVIYFDDCYKDKILFDENGCQKIKLTNNKEMIDATRFAWERSEITNSITILLLQYKFLDEYYKVNEHKERTIYL